MRNDMVLTPTLSARDVPGWDSFKQIEIMVSTEERFGIKLNTREIDGLKCVGDPGGRDPEKKPSPERAGAASFALASAARIGHARRPCAAPDRACARKRYSRHLTRRLTYQAKPDLGA